MFSFDGREVEVSNTTDGGVLPDGQYNVIADDWCFRDSAAGNRYFEITFSVVTGQYAGWKAWAKFSLEHPDPEVVQRARKDLARLLVQGFGIPPVFQSPDELMRRGCVITTKQREYNGKTYVDIKRYAKASEAAVSASTATPATPSRPVSRTEANEIAPF